MPPHERELTLGPMDRDEERSAPEIGHLARTRATSEWICDPNALIPGPSS